MKVLHLIGGGDTGGAKTHVLSLLQNINKSIDVKMVSLRSGIFAEDAKALGIQIEVVQSWNIFSDVIKVVRIIKDEKYEILHSHGAKANLISVMSKIFTGIPNVTTVHSDYKLDYMHSFIKRYSIGLLNTIALRFFDYHICVSSSLKTFLIKRCFKINNLFTIPNGIEFDNPLSGLSRENFALKHNLKFNRDTIVVGILARLTAVKGLPIFIHSAARVVKDNPNVKFIIGGDGEDRKPLESLVEQMGISDRVIFLGHVTESYEFMNFIDINVLSSISEGFPYSILEGARLNKATISSRVGGIPDLITSGENGYLFTPGDDRELAEYILNLAGNESLRKEMGEKINCKSKKLYSIANMCQSQLDIYNKILQRTKDVYVNDIILSGYYGFQNSGDDAILMSIIDNLRTRKEDVRIMVLSKTPLDTRLQYFVNSISRFNLLKIILAMRKTKLYINGGGNLMQDSTSTRSILYYLVTTWIAKLMGCKIMVYANGIGPINKKFNRKLTTFVLNQVDIITLRENLSIKELSDLKITKPKIIVTADPALTLGAINSNDIDEIFKKEEIPLKGSFVGFSARICENNVKFDESIVAQIADYMVEKYGITPIFIPMQAKDLTIIGSIISKMKHTGYVIKDRYDALSIIGIISRTELLIGMRLHSLLYAASVGIPVVGLVYDTKIEAFIQYFHQTSAGDVRELKLDRFIPIVDKVWKNRKQAKADLIQLTAELKEKAFDNSRIAIELLEKR